MAVTRVHIVALSVNVETVHLQQNVAGSEHRSRVALVGHIDDHHAALFAFELQVIKRLRVFGGLPGEIKIAEAFVMAFFLRVENRANERRRQHLQLVPGLREDQTDDFAAGDGRLRPAHTVDFRT